MCFFRNLYFLKQLIKQKFDEFVPTVRVFFQVRILFRSHNSCEYELEGKLSETDRNLKVDDEYVI